MNQFESYNPAAIEHKWHDIWAKNKTFHTDLDRAKEKFYALIEFPYPSGEGLHVGHPRPYTALDIVARKRRIEGYNVLFPMGWDAFGLPAENYAIKNKVHPSVVTQKNVAHFKDQLTSIGFSFDWDREINTTDPDYYRWTQWIFIQMYKHGLAYKKEFPINWCPSCKAGLANEEVTDGKCEICGTPVERRVKNQWMLKITQYADRLIDDLDTIDYLPRIKQQQINWIGRSHGAEVDFAIENSDEKLRVFTTRPDTLFGATYMVLAPEHPILQKLKDRIQNNDEIRNYQDAAKKKSDFERGELAKDKTGVCVDGIQAINPATGNPIPIWISDYVLMSYGTGAIMSVPAHDGRDWEFAKKFDLPIVEVVAGGQVQEEAFTDTEQGVMVNSGFMDGMHVDDAKKAMLEFLEKNGLGEAKVNYKLRDWVFTRQRYWGEPIPMVWCDDCGWVSVPEDQLPVRLPEVENYEPTDDGESPLSKIESFVNTTCPCCGKPAKRETDTMPQWAGSSWYYLRYMDPHCATAPVSQEAVDYFGPVDWYNGGMEHTTLHLLYSRFWHKFLYDIGVVPTKEPYQKRTSHGMILGMNPDYDPESNVPEHRQRIIKMSKSKGNVVNPDDIVRDYGADTLRTYEMFIGDFEKSAAWQEEGVIGCRKFLDRVWRMQEIVVDGDAFSPELEVLMNQTIKKVSDDFETLKYNTALAQLMTLSNEMRQKGSITKKEMEAFLVLLNPVAPHITEEMWERLGFAGQIATDAKWPVWDENKLESDTIEMPVQVNGKVRATIEIGASEEKESVLNKAKANEQVQKFLDGKSIVKEIYIPKKILNIVVK